VGRSRGEAGGGTCGGDVHRGGTAGCSSPSSHAGRYRTSCPTPARSCFLLARKWSRVLTLGILSTLPAQRRPVPVRGRREGQKGKPGDMAANADDGQPELVKVAHPPPSRDSGSLGCRVSALKHLGSDMWGARSDQSRTEKHVFSPAPARAGSGQALRRGEPDGESRTGVPRIPEQPQERGAGFLRAHVRGQLQGDRSFGAAHTQTRKNKHAAHPQ